jgi:hypothetical protein
MLFAMTSSRVLRAFMPLAEVLSAMVAMVGVLR